MPTSCPIRRRLRGLVIAAMLVAAAPAWGGGDTGEWLGRMAEAMRTANYEGTLVYAYDGEMETLSVVHGIVDGVERERIRALTGEPFEVIREGEIIRCMWPSSERMLVSQRPATLLPSGLPQGLESLPGLYSSQVEDVTRIAGRIARVVRIHSSDEFRYGYRLWIDRESHLLLRSDLVAPDGEVVERLMFTNLSVSESIDPERFEPSYGDRDYVSYEQPDGRPEALDEPEWRVADLPPGFHTVTHRSQAMPSSGNSVQQSVFSDGLASVSVFIDPAGDAPRSFEGAAAMGAVNAFVTWVDGRAITAVGEVPPVTVRRIALAVEPAGDPTSQ